MGITHFPEEHPNLNSAILALEDGSVFEGGSFGAPVERSGEVVFNTALTGYQIRTSQTNEWRRGQFVRSGDAGQVRVRYIGKVTPYSCATVYLFIGATRSISTRRIGALSGLGD